MAKPKDNYVNLFAYLYFCLTLIVDCFYFRSYFR